VGGVSEKGKATGSLEADGVFWGSEKAQTAKRRG